MSEKFKILIADDSAIARGIMEKNFSQSEHFEVVTSVSNGRKTVDFCRDNTVDVVVSDCDMSEMDGIQAAKILTSELNIPVIIYADSNSRKAEALEAGASAFLIKPPLSSYNPKSYQTFIENVYSVILQKGIQVQKVQNSQDSDSESVDSEFKILCIGASTGGPAAVKDVLLGLGKNFPLPVLYVQHIDVGADDKMVAWFNSVCPNIPMHLARDGAVAQKGHVYMAPAEKHLVIDYIKTDGSPVIKLSDEPPERFLRPAVNKLFRSAAHHYKSSCLALLMTGMGRDGAEGCKEIVDNGGYTIAEDRSTCAVFGMPAAAIELNAAKLVLPRPLIPSKVLAFAGKK